VSKSATSLKWKQITIGALISEVKTRNPSRTNDDEFDYIDIGSVDQERKEISAVKSILGVDAPSRARQILASGDILISTVRPNLNAVAVVPAEYAGAIGSTGFCVLRAQRHLVDLSFLFQWVKSSEFISDMVKKATGASYPAVSDRIILESEIPLPPLPEQCRIAQILDKAEALRAKRRAALAKLDTLAQSIFLEMFGDPESHGWQFSTIEHVADPAKGSIRTGPFGSQLLHSEFVESGVAVLGIDNAVRNEFQWGERRYITAEKYKALSRYKVYPGDILITIMGTCGRCAIVPSDIQEAINTKHLCCITPDSAKICSPFLHAYFLKHPIALKYLGNLAKGAIMDGLNMGIIKNMPIPLPPLPLQQAFARRVEAIETLKAAHRASLAKLDALFASLQHRAFRGEL